MKQTLSLILVFSFFLANSQICKLSDEQRQKIYDEKIKFITDELQLTAVESEKFIPLYKEFEDKEELLHQEKRKTMNSYKNNSLNMSSEEKMQTADKLIEFEILLAQLQKTYHEKYKTVLPAEKIILLYKSEHEFKKYLLKVMKEKNEK